MVDSPTDPSLLAEQASQILEEPDEPTRLALFKASGDPEALLGCLKAEVDRNMTVDGAKAFGAAERALELGQYLQTEAALALGHWAYALGLTVQGEFQEALDHYAQARELYQKIGNEISAQRVATRQVQALAITGQFEQALLLAETVRDGFRAQGLAPDEARITNNIGIILKRLGRYDEAIPTLEAAKQAFESLDDHAGIALTHQNLADAHAHLDRFQEALDHVEAAATLFENLGQTNNLAGALVEKAFLYRRVGRLASVLDTLARARGLFEGLGHSADAAFAQLEEARIHLDLNLLDEAEVLARGSIQTFADKGMHLEELEAQTVLGLTLAKLQQFDEAASVLSTARNGWLTLDNRTQAAWSGVYLTTLLLERAGDEVTLDRAEAAQAEAHLNAALESFDVGQARAGQAVARILLARVLQSQARHDEAKQRLVEAGTLVAELGIPDLSIRLNRVGGQLALNCGDLDEAESAFRKAIEELEGVRASLNSDEFKTSYLGEKLDVYSDLTELLIERGRTEGAFHFVERSKSRALLDLIGKGVSFPSEAASPQVADLQQQLLEARFKLNQDYLKAEQEAQSHAAWDEVRKSETQVTTLIRDIERLTPSSTVEQVSVPSVEEVLTHLNPDVIILEYISLHGTLAAFIVTNEGIRLAQPLGQVSEVTKAVERLNFTMSRVAQGQVYEQVYGADVLNMRTQTGLKTLYDLLIAPLDLELNGQNLIIVPHDALHTVPFAALFDGQTYLHDKALVSLAPSTAIYLHCARQTPDPKGGVVAFGVPFEDIPFVQQEVEAVASIFPDTHALMGPEATLATFMEQAPNANVLHVATHGVYRPDNPLFSGLRFHDGWLAARDLYTLKLNSSLVVLSACETGLSSRQSSDELFGLARGFFFAGTPCLIVSLWAVKDTPTSILMVAFYKGLKEGLPVAEALQRAQHVVRKDYPNPYYWAAFNVVGDPERHVVNPSA